MKKVIDVSDRFDDKENPIDLTHRKSHGWIGLTPDEAKQVLKNSYRVLYLGSCKDDGDMFAVYSAEYIVIYKGFLNSGMYN